MTQTLASAAIVVVHLSPPPATEEAACQASSSVNLDDQAALSLFLDFKSISDTEIFGLSALMSRFRTRTLGE